MYLGHFFYIWAPVWNPCSHCFPSCWHHFFEHRFHIDFVSMWRLILVTFFMFLLIPFRFAHANCKTFSSKSFYNEFTYFYTPEKHDFHNFHDIFHSLFWHWFLMMLAIDFGFILEHVLCFFYFCSRSSCWCCRGCFLDFTRFMIRKWKPERPPQV